MKKYMVEFIRRGLVAWGFGPLVLAVIYLILRDQANVQTLTVAQVCIGIISLSALAFIAGGMNFIYQIERLPLMLAILIHDWLERGIVPILVFTGIFVLGYVVIWVIIYSIIKRNTDRLNEGLKKKQQRAE